MIFLKRNAKNNPYLPKRNLLFLVLVFVVLITVGLVLLLSNRTGTSDENNPGRSGAALYFSEIMSSNGSSCKFEDGKFHDWLEIHNPGKSEADVSGFSLLGPDGKSVYAFPQGTKIPAGGYLAVICDKGYTDFKLSAAGGQTITLQDRAGKTVDEVRTSKLEPGFSMIRTEYPGTWSITSEITPGFANDADGRAAYRASLFNSAAGTAEIVINEIMAVNHLTVRDTDGDFSDWVELKNISDHAVSLKNYTISDRADDLYQWVIPDVTLQSGECITIFCSGKNRTDTEKELHTSFRLSEYDGALYLAQPNGFVCDSVSYSQIPANASYERLESGGFAMTYAPTPGFDNSEAGRKAFAEQSESSLPELVIWEAMSKNTSYIRTNGGKYYDWVELKNISDHNVSLAGYRLSASRKEDGWQIPEKVLKPGESVVLYCSGLNVTSARATTWHTDFKINGKEEIYLLNDSGIVDAVCLLATATDTSIGRMDGEKGWFYLDAPTPGYANSAAGRTAFEKATGASKKTWAVWRSVTAAPVAEIKSGVYNDVDTVCVRLFGEGTIYYSIYDSGDGGKTPRHIDGLKYNPETGILLTKTAAIRAYAVADGKRTSSLTWATYIVNEKHTMDVVSVTLDHDDLWSDSRGIYALGPNARDDAERTGANFYKDWERAGYVALFCSDEEGFSLPCGVKIFGGASRAGDKKSLLLKFRDRYGEDELVYNVFDNDIYSFKSLVLRSGSQDYLKSMLRDEWLTALATDGSEHLYALAYRPVVLYLNGAYFGVYFIREKMGDDYISKHLNVSTDSIDLLVCNGLTPQLGSSKDYRALINYVNTHDLRKKEYYDYVCSQVDIYSLMDQKIARFFSGDQDTGNIRFFRSSEDDGKWHWVLYDLDYAFYYYTKFSYYVTKIRPGFGDVDTIFRQMIKNDTFRDIFLKRIAEQLKTRYSYENALSSLDALAATLEPEMPRNCERWQTKTEWGSTVGTYSGWVRSLEDIRQRLRVNMALEPCPDTGYSSNGVSWYKTYRASLYSRIKEFFDLSDAEFVSYFGHIEHIA